MHKVTLLCLASERDLTLQKLGELGAVHLEPISAGADADLERSRSVLRDIDRALAFLAEYPVPHAAHAGQTGRPSVTDMGVLITEILALEQKHQLLEERCEVISDALEQWQFFGDFNPATIKTLQAHGIDVALCHATSRRLMLVPDVAIVRILHEEAVGIYYAVIGRDLGQIANRQEPPEFALSGMRAQSSAIASEMDTITKRIAELAKTTGAIQEYAGEMASAVDFYNARAGMGANAAVAYIQGYCPVERLSALEANARTSGWGIVTREPVAGENVPTLVRMPRWVKPIESMFKLIKIFPGYREVDVSASFLLFLSLFFAMIVGDAGYGAIFLVATIFARIKMPKAPPEPFRLLAIFSVCTMVWGILTGVYFGLSGLPGLFSPRVQWLTDDTNIMALCILIGAIHLSVAHVWNMIRVINSTRAIAQAGWVAITWVIYFAARSMLLKASMPGFVLPLGIIGIVAILFFMTPLKLLKAEWVNHAMLPLTLMSNFGDILSYLRLWALGIAGIQLADAFNTIVGQIWGAGILGWIGGVLILFLGHGLNLILSALSVLVHGIRLNALEFSMHIGLEWTGFEYKPFVARPIPAE